MAACSWQVNSTFSRGKYIHHTLIMTMKFRTNLTMWKCCVPWHRKYSALVKSTSHVWNRISFTLELCHSSKCLSYNLFYCRDQAATWWSKNNDDDQYMMNSCDEKATMMIKYSTTSQNYNLTVKEIKFQPVKQPFQPPVSLKRTISLLPLHTIN